MYWFLFFLFGTFCLYWLRVLLVRSLTWPLKMFFRLSNHLFYDTTYHGQEFLRRARSGPRMVIGHHPYHLEDPKIVGGSLPGTFAVVAKAPLFENEYPAVPVLHLRGRIRIFLLHHLSRIRIFLLHHLLRMHPIYREQDGATRDQMKANLRKINELAEFMANGGMLVIFPEGQSGETRRHVDPFKDGPARMLLKAQALLDKMPDPSFWEKSLAVMTFGYFGRLQRWESVMVYVVGHTVSDYARPFRTNVAIHATEPILVKEYAAQGKAARSALTEKMAKMLREQIAEVSDNHRELVERVQRFYRMDIPDARDRITKVEAVVQAINPTDEGLKATLSEKLDQYFDLARELWIHPGMERIHASPFMLLLLPLSWFGWLINLIPLKMAFKRLAEKEYFSTEVGVKKFSMIARNLCIWHIGLLVLLALIATAWTSLTTALLAMFGYMLVGSVCTVIAIWTVRPINAMMWSLLRTRTFKRYRALGEEIAEILDSHRIQASS